MDGLLSPSNAEGGNSAFAASEPLNEDGLGPQDDYIPVKIYFHGSEKVLRSRVFP
jgi:hypothetical protein